MQLTNNSTQQLILLYWYTIPDKVDRTCKGGDTFDESKPWKPVHEEPRYPYVQVGTLSPPRTNTLPKFLHDIITKAPVIHRPRPTPTVGEKNRTPRKPQPNKASDLQGVQSKGASVSLSLSYSLSVSLSLLVSFCKYKSLPWSILLSVCAAICCHGVQYCR